MFCWLEFKINNHFTIGPLKFEFLARNPDVVQVHNAIDNADLVDMSASGPFPRVDLKIERQIEQKLAAITGLRTNGYSAADPTVLRSDLPGGNTDLHVDVVR